MKVKERHALIIDGILRDYIFQGIATFNKYAIEGVETIDVPMSGITSGDLQEVLGMTGSDDDDITYTEWLEEFALELKGFAPELVKFGVAKLVSNLEGLYDKLGHTLVLVDKAIGKEIGATLLFLSKHTSQARNLQFVEAWGELNEYDKIITTNPRVMKRFPDKCIKINTIYNTESKCADSYDTLQDYIDEITV